MKFKAEDRAQKVGGSYQAIGTIKAAWLADDGTPRYVFRFDVPCGLLHIFSETQLEHLSPIEKPETDDYDYAMNQWWVKELEAVWTGQGMITDDMKRAAKIALNVLTSTLPPTLPST